MAATVQQGGLKGGVEYSINYVEDNPPSQEEPKTDELPENESVKTSTPHATDKGKPGKPRLSGNYADRYFEWLERLVDKKSA